MPLATAVQVTAPSAASATRSPGDVDNRAAYIGFGLACVFGHGSAALSKGTSPLLDLPAWLPMALLGAGLAVGTVQATRAALRAQRGAAGPDVLSGKLLGASWLIGFAALFLAITGLASAVEVPDLQSMSGPPDRASSSACSTSAKAPHAATSCTTVSASGSR
ncbi:hypothetical protein [Streptomyces sp. RTd22]|uniref:hypothetical protein n=1 Tax=Streptomyces sp. RTd22 TaxID=1841249 RepID=UPI001F236CEC|nr:hypothetical protein [Streptomyces sp. RTd22]